MEKKNRIKKTVLIVCAAWLLMGAADFALVMTCHRPLFCIRLASDAHSEKFAGLGYSFDLIDRSKGVFEIDAYKRYILGREICGNYMD